MPRSKLTDIVDTGKLTQVGSSEPGKGNVQRKVYEFKRTYVETISMNRETLLFRKQELEAEIIEIQAALLQMPASAEPKDTPTPTPAP